MWSLGIVVLPPSLDHDLRFAEGIEDLPVEQLISETSEDVSQRTA
jgi:hypothetical protein